MSATILVVEDEAIVADDIQASLRRLGYEVPSLVASGEEALAEAKRRPFDLALMDIRLQGELDGIETAQLVRDRHNLPVVFLTSHSDEATLARAKDAAPYGYIVKPFHERDLRTTIEVALRKHELDLARARWYTATVQSMGDAVIGVDRDEVVNFMNPTAEQLTGWTFAEARGKKAREVLRLQEPTGEPPDGLLQAALDSRSTRQSRELRLQTRTGSLLLVEVSTTPITDPRSGDVNPPPLGAVVLFRNLTEQRERERRTAQNERLASLSGMAGGLAHEINNPLAYMSPNIEFVVERLRHFSSLENLPEELSQVVRQDCAEMITALTEAESGAERIRRLVLSLKNFTRRETAERTVVFPPDLLDSVASYTASASKHHIPVVKECGPTPHIEANEQELTQALTNIAINAAQATRQSPGQRNVIVLRTATDSYGRAVIEIEDTGHGIHPSNLSRVFDPFFTTRAASGHIGLGLAFSRDIIVNSLGGELSIERTSERGTTFRITIPPAVPREEEPTTATQHARILIIDDEPFVARAIERILQPSYEVTTATSAADALSRLAAGEEFGAILCDLTMAEMDGPEFFSVLSQRWPDLANTVIFITGGATSDSIVDFVASCSRPVIAKPLDAPKLRAKIESVLRDA